MKVYIVQELRYSSEPAWEIVAVFKSQERAQERAQEITVREPGQHGTMARVEEADLIE